jgi:hypothetical protein
MCRVMPRLIAMNMVATKLLRRYCADMAETVTLREAAQRLGKSEKSIRRYLKQGWLEGQLLSTPRGERWLVQMPADGIVRPPTVVSTAGQSTAPQNADLDRVLAALAVITERQEYILTRLDALLAAQPPVPVFAAHEEAPPSEEKRRRWWSWLVWG